ncbi:MAG: dodecin family protein [Acidimicrobiia bacterium]
MSVAKTVELTSRSDESFDDAIRKGVAKASETIQGLKQAWVMNQKVILDGAQISAYQVDLRVTFVVN